MLRVAPDYKISFNKLIPSYHQHFGRQCRVGSYGFSKLLELLEAVSGVMEVGESKETGEGGDAQ